jgi:hypothetical protein
MRESRFRRPDRSGRLQYRLELGRGARPADDAALSRVASRVAAQPASSLACRRGAQVSRAKRRDLVAPTDYRGVEGGLPEWPALTNPHEVKD